MKQKSFSWICSEHLDKISSQQKQTSHGEVRFSKNHKSQKNTQYNTIEYKSLKIVIMTHISKTDFSQRITMIKCRT